MKMNVFENLTINLEKYIKIEKYAFEHFWPMGLTIDDFWVW